MGIQLRNQPASGKEREGRPKSTAAGPQPRLFTRFSEIHPQKPEWLWEYRIPLGEISVIDGDPGKNKSCATRQLSETAPRISV